MVKVIHEYQNDPYSRFQEVVSSARYVVGPKGGATDVVVSLSAWKHLWEALEDLDDRMILKSWLSRLQAGPKLSGALRWEDVADEWEDDETPI